MIDGGVSGGVDHFYQVIGTSKALVDNGKIKEGTKRYN
jgi:hypothetical protein